MKQQIIDYFNNMKRLDGQGAPIDWYKVAENIVLNVQQLPDPAPEDPKQP